MENHHFQWENSLFHTISMAMFNSFLNVYQKVKQVSSKPPLVVLWLSHIDGTPPLLELPNAVAWTKGASCHRTSHKAWPNVGDRQWDAHGFLSNLWQLYLVGGIPTPLKNMSSSVGMMKFPIYGTMKMFQTTNQICNYCSWENCKNKRLIKWLHMVSYATKHV